MRRDHAGDRFSDDDHDRIEWHVDQARRWLRILAVVAISYVVYDVMVRPFL